MLLSVHFKDLIKLLLLRLNEKANKTREHTNQEYVTVLPTCCSQQYNNDIDLVLLT